MILTVVLLILTVVSASNTTTTWHNPEKYDCRPDKDCWPTEQEFDKFNETISGRLRKTTMLGSACFPSSPDYNEDTCAEVKRNEFNATFRQDYYGAMGTVQFEACGDANCLPALAGEKKATCSLGRMSSFYVAAEETKDIVETLKFVTQHRIRLVVKNTGHDFMGRSASANSLTLWTYNMKKQEYHGIYRSPNCAAVDGYDIGVIEAGVTAQEANEFFIKHNKVVTTGGCPSVGIAGGFGQGGGHGPLGPLVGLMVDQAVEFDVVTTDGQERTINECSEPDLFWAMRGGGGQSFAILTRYKFKLHPSTSFATWHFRANISANAITPKITQSKVLRDIMKWVVMNQLFWTRNHIAGSDIYTPTSVEFLAILPAVGDASERLRAFTKLFAYYLGNHTDLEVITSKTAIYQNLMELDAGTADFTSRAAPSGIGAIIPSRLVTRDIFEDLKKQKELVNAMLLSMETAVERLGLDGAGAQVGFTTQKTFPTYVGGAIDGTSLNPVFRDVVWQYATPGAWLPGTPGEKIEAIKSAARAALEPVKKILSVQAAYTNEADPEEKHWEKLFWGRKNYDRLVDIKRKYDPHSVLNCWKCPGFLSGDPMYSCYDESTPVATSSKLYRDEVYQF